MDKIHLKRIYDLREDNDKTQEEIAKILRTTKQTYGKYERGKLNLKIEDLEILCRYYDVSADYILGLINKKESYKRRK